MSEAIEVVEEVTGADLRAALRARYSETTGYAVFSEVRDSTGHLGGTRRWADFIAMGTWPSRGLEIEGFELKDARSDWLRELKEPAKADKIFRFCDRWYLLSAPGVAKAEEIPAPWGWIEHRHSAKGTTLRMRKPAPKLEPAELSRPFLASLLRELSREAGEERIARACVETRNAVERECIARSARKKIEAMPAGPSRLDAELIANARAFERETGISLRNRDGFPRIKQAVDTLDKIHGARWTSATAALRESIKASLAAIRAIRKARSAREGE